LKHIEMSRKRSKVKTYLVFALIGLHAWNDRDDNMENEY